jgi:CHAD domain-containing protein
VRRTRSALSQVKGVLPDPPLQQHRDELKWLGSVTGPVRDLDVFLLGFDALIAGVSAPARVHLEPLRGHLLQERTREFKKLRRALRSKRLEQHLEQWPAFLEAVRSAHIDNDAPRAGSAVAALAARRIRRTDRALRAGGRAIQEDSPPEALHVLRIQAKKLRYLLELFRGLLESEAFARQHGALKKLQSVLGDFNDCAVQEAALTGFAQEMQAAGTLGLETTLAIGRLAERIAQRAEVLRRRFGEAFASFDATELREDFAAMLERLGAEEEAAR